MEARQYLTAASSETDDIFDMGRERALLWALALCGERLPVTHTYACSLPPQPNLIWRITALSGDVIFYVKLFFLLLGMQVICWLAEDIGLDMLLAHMAPQIQLDMFYKAFIF